VSNNPDPRKRPARRRAAWQVVAEDELRRLRHELEASETPPDLEKTLSDSDADAFVKRQRAVVEENLDRAEEALQPVRGPMRRIRFWYTGAAVEDAWRSLHRAGEALLLIQSQTSLASEFVDIEKAFAANIESGDPGRADLRQALGEARRLLLEEQQPWEVTAVLRSKLLAARRAANVTSDTAHSTVRSWRNVLLKAGGVLGALAIAVAVIHAFVPDFLSLAPSGEAQEGDAVEPWAVEAVGILGGALAAVLALARFRGFTDPYGLPTTQALLRIPTSAVTSLFGVVLMQTAALELFQPQEDATTVLAYAFVFGYAQEPLLRMIDQKAGEVLNPARSKDEPS
jgi:hypothetical protein